jgi:hypothetical protein
MKKLLMLVGVSLLGFSIVPLAYACKSGGCGLGNSCVVVTIPNVGTTSSCMSNKEEVATNDAIILKGSKATKNKVFRVKEVQTKHSRQKIVVLDEASELKTLQVDPKFK